MQTEDDLRRGLLELGTSYPVVVAAGRRATGRRAQRQRAVRIVPIVVCLLIAAAGLSKVVTNDRSSSRVRVVSPVPNSKEQPSGSILPATVLKRPAALAVSLTGTLLIADSSRNQIFELLPDGRLRVIAGTGTAGYSGDGAPANNAELRQPRGLAVDANGVIFIADTENNRLRRITSDGNISTVAGDGVARFAGDGGPAREASLSGPLAVAVHPDGSIYVADTGNARVRRITSTGAISTIAGNGNPGWSGDGGDATEASLDPAAIAFDGNDNLVVFSFATKHLRLVSDGVIRTLAADTYLPALASAPDGTVLAADYAYRLTRIGKSGALETVLSFDSADRGLPGVPVPFRPTAIAVTNAGDVYLADAGDSAGASQPTVVQVANNHRATVLIG